MIGEEQPLAFLTIGTRAKIVLAVAAILDVGELWPASLEMPVWQTCERPISPRPVSAVPATRPRILAPADDQRYHGLARTLQAHPAWIAAEALPAVRRQAIEARLMRRALEGCLSQKFDSSEPASAPVHR